MKLITKYNRILLPSLIVLFIISGISSYFLIRKTLQNELDQMLLRSKKRIVKYVTANNSVPDILSFDDQKVSFEKIAVPLTDSGITSATQYIPEQKKEHISRRLVFQIKVKEELYRVVISEPFEGTRHLTTAIVKIDIASIFLILLLLFLLNRSLLYRLWQPFYNSLAAIKSFNINENIPLKFPPTSTEEFKLMNNHFYMAAENALREYKILKEFSENASHEIQTPLAIIHSKLDLLLQQESLNEEQCELIRSAYLSVNKLSALNKALLLLTKIDNHQFPKSSDIYLDRVIKNKINDFHDFWVSKNISYTVEIEETLVNTNSELLEILLNNIFSNATRHNHTNGFIGIILKNKKIQISNSGSLTALDQNRLFKRFYKEIPTGENNGLGLSIIKEICTVSGVDITYSYKNEKHLFCLTWV
jgi:signal transduction histidine kinase